MTIRERLTQDLKEAMKSGDEIRRNAIRNLRSAIRYAEIDMGHELSDEEAIEVVAKQVKQRRDSIEQFQQGNRPDLVKQEQQELDIIETYLPPQLTDEEITERAQAVIAEVNATSMKDMGKVMGILSREMKGLADGKRISEIVRELLSG
ncbi:MAG: GatB/YqeY domain-containing protein [Aliifodinibius sp.]|nr:GatB/YqeY domain-containing protein [Fodinibius sp.]NIV14723.1 GatB/YqeY domain-containing protein [Fodinibius sp.]NIY28622.1 GatB/YqeY domain-containing protein [Fodinibius sp.]